MAAEMEGAKALVQVWVEGVIDEEMKNKIKAMKEKKEAGVSEEEKTEKKEKMKAVIMGAADALTPETSLLDVIKTVKTALMTAAKEEGELANMDESMKQPETNAAIEKNVQAWMESSGKKTMGDLGDMMMDFMKAIPMLVMIVVAKVKIDNNLADEN